MCTPKFPHPLGPIDDFMYRSLSSGLIYLQPSDRDTLGSAFQLWRGQPSATDPYPLGLGRNKYQSSLIPDPEN